MQFPELESKNLLGDALTLPQDFEGTWNVVLVAFKRWQQAQVDTWLPFLKHLMADREDVRTYELPVIEQMNFLARGFINQGMRMGIRDEDALRRTITLYLDKDAFREALDLPDEDEIYVLLLDDTGDVIWRARGSYTAEQGEALQARINAG